MRKILRISRRFLRAYFMYIKKINGETHKGSRQPAQRDDYEISPCFYYLFLETATLFSVTVQICFVVIYAIERVRMKPDTRIFGGSHRIFGYFLKYAGTTAKIRPGYGKIPPEIRIPVLCEHGLRRHGIMTFIRYRPQVFRYKVQILLLKCPDGGRSRARPSAGTTQDIRRRTLKRRR